MIVDSYDGAYGLTIRISARSPSDLEAVQSVFAELASGRLEEADLCVRLSGCSSSVRWLLLVSCTEPSLSGLRIKERSPEGMTFIWQNTLEDWSECLQKTSALIAYNKPAHQYLTKEGLDDALIELSFLEGSDTGR